MRLPITFIGCFFVLCAVIIPDSVTAQCVGLPSVTSLGSNKFPVGLCAPVQANVTYTIGFTTPVPPGPFELVYDWGDGTDPEVVPLSSGDKNYSASRTHIFPPESDCEYFVTMAIHYRGKVCTSTSQVQKISSWRTDQYNGGDIGLVSPATTKDTHLVCVGEDIDIIFQDESDWNCNALYTPPGQDPNQSPNTEYRWQQIVYNTAVPGNKIPNVRVDGVPVTGTDGSDISENYQDPRGIFYMSAPVLANDSRRRPSLNITAPGGFGTGFPKSGDEFALTLRYWNFCNPYDDPEIPGPPLDLINGDHPPVEKTARIRVLPPPAALTTTNQAACFGKNPSPFSVTGITGDNVVSWYKYIPGSDEAGELIASGASSSLPISSDPAWKNNITPGIFRVWASQRTNTISATNCESPKVLVTRILREALTVPEPLSTVPTEICNQQSFTVTLPPPATEVAGGDTQYTWTGSSGVVLQSSTAISATFTVNIADFGTALFVDRTVMVQRQYTATPLCAAAKTFSVRIHRTLEGGTLSGQTQLCETSPVGVISLSGYIGIIQRWEMRKDDGAYSVYTGESLDNGIAPGVLAPGTYWFRAVVGNGPCEPVYSDEKKIEVSINPPPSNAGDDQFVCSALSSAALNASDAYPGTGTWSYISSVPSGLPRPSFDVNDANTTVVITPENAGVYTLRWTVTNGSCSSADDVIIDFGTNPTDPDAGVDRSVCGAETSLNGNVPGKGQGNWSIVSGPGGCIGSACAVTLVTPASPVSRVALQGPDFTYGTYTFRWSISSGGNNCFLKTDDVTITFHEPVTIAATDITGLCLDNDDLRPIELTGTIEGPATDVNWIVMSGSGTVSSFSESNNDGVISAKASYQPATADYVSGAPITIKLTATPLHQSCLRQEKIVTISFQRKPVAEGGSDIRNICASHATLQATTPAFSATGAWTTTQSGVTFDDPADPQTTVRNLPIGNTVVSWTVTSEIGTCVSAPSAVTLTRVAPPEAIDLAITGCEVQPGATSVTLIDYEDSITSLPENDREISWYKNQAPPLGIPVADPSVTQTPVTNGQVFFARIRDEKTACTSDAKVTVGVRPLPIVMNAVITQCEDQQGSNTASGIDLSDMTFTNAITIERNVTVSWHHSEADATADRLPVTEPVLVTGQKEFFARVAYRDSPSCVAMARLNLVISSQPAVTSILGRESVCQGTSSPGFDDLSIEVYQVMPVPGAKYHWQIPDDENSEFKVFGGGGENDFYVLLQFPNVYSGKISVWAEKNGCTGPAIEKQITVSASPTRPVIEGSAIICDNSSAVAFSVSPNNAPASAYNWEIRNASDNTPGGAYIMEGQMTGNILVNFATADVIISVRENNSTCVSPVATKVVTVTDPPKANLLIEREVSCFLASDGAIKTEITGGTAPFTAFEIVQTGYVDDDIDGVFEQLPQGSYSIRVTDSNGCIATSNTQILKQPDQVTIDRIFVPADANGYNVSCRDGSDGEITVEFSGGNDTSDYTVALTKNSTSSAGILSGNSSVTFSGLAPATYSIEVKDANGCASVPAVAFVVNPQPLYAGAIGTDQVICSGEDPDVIRELTPAQGGTGNFLYEWQVSLSGDVDNDAAWTTLPGETGLSYDPPALTTTASTGEQHHYRRLVKNISYTRDGQLQVCEIKGKTEKVTITVNPVPRVEFTSGTQEICEGDALALTLKLTKGKAPMEFDYATSDNTYLNQTGPVTTTLTIPDFRRDETYTLLRVKDANGCTVEELPPALDVRVIKIEPDFTIALPASPCGGGEFVFTWQAQKGVDYRWEWSDGTSTDIKAEDISEGENRLSHTFHAISAVNETEYHVKLFASHLGCLEKVVGKPVRISPAINLNILAGDTLLCSGEDITFYNNSSGVDTGRWYYRKPGTSGVLESIPSTGKNVTVAFHNTTLTNAIVYEVVYEADNSSGCSAVYRKQVVVYRSNPAAFEVGLIPPFDTDDVQVGVTNTSEAIDPGQFEFIWNFGEQGFANVPPETASFDITYYSPGAKEISLSIMNIEAQQAGKMCQSVYRKVITVPVSQLNASFTATPFASCFPVTVQVTNASTGANTFFWTLSRAGALVTTSNLKDPGFRITDPGIYDIHLTASVAGTGQTAEAELRGIQVLDVPDAAFDIRAGVVYVPDTEVQVFNFSSGASHYEWHFGDGNTSDAFEPSHTYQNKGRYSIVLYSGQDHGRVDSDGDGIADVNMVCYDSARQEVIALQGGDLKIPNAFTPDTSGPNGGRATEGTFNDVFLPAGKGITHFRMLIYDRWGSLVFESNDKDTGWDGYDRSSRLMPAGVYIYKINVRQSDGESVTRTGDIALIR